MAGFPWATLISEALNYGQQQANKPINEAPANKVGSSIVSALPNVYGTQASYSPPSPFTNTVFQPHQYGSNMTFDPLGIQGQGLMAPSGGSNIPAAQSPFKTNVDAATGGAGK